ncbi:HAD family hydrolase [Gramella sp. MT6]|uniref:HAD family hydrolase n=1 Tax=Gramella sp. MT6 TaxID=2705471 RepID=UPI001C5E80A1|nr:HAD-IA family hydrolase [Gramella sp. MT6]QYA26038.1 HAD family hydrolase [Gramella sp. MT6]
MKDLSNYQNILWDFDGVLMDSMPVRNRGFEIVLKNYPNKEVEQLMRFHLNNGGLSRFVKFRYFFENIRNEDISENQIKFFAGKFSEVMRNELLNEKLLISDTVEFVKRFHEKFNMHIVSGSDQKELRFICKKLNLKSYFLSINGSPTPKKELVSILMGKHDYQKDKTVLIGDSINDYEAAEYNGIEFRGYNNKNLKRLEAGYIESFSDGKD